MYCTLVSNCNNDATLSMSPASTFVDGVWFVKAHPEMHPDRRSPSAAFITTH